MRGSERRSGRVRGAARRDDRSASEPTLRSRSADYYVAGSLGAIALLLAGLAAVAIRDPFETGLAVGLFVVVCAAAWATRSAL